MFVAARYLTLLYEHITVNRDHISAQRRGIFGTAPAETLGGPRAQLAKRLGRRQIFLRNALIR